MGWVGCWQRVGVSFVVMLVVVGIFRAGGNSGTVGGR